MLLNYYCIADKFGCQLVRNLNLTVCELLFGHLYHISRLQKKL